MKNKKFPFKLQQEDAIKIINSACTTSWKETLIDKWCHEIFINGIVEINEQFYKEMRCDCNETQHKLFDDIFGKDELIIKYKIGDIIMTLDKANENPIGNGNENDDKGGKGFIPSTLLKIVYIRDYADYQILFFYNHISGIYSNSVRPATEEEIKNYCPYAKDELILVKLSNIWSLRYSTGKFVEGRAECYIDQLKSKDTSIKQHVWNAHKPCPQNLLD